MLAFMAYYPSSGIFDKTAAGATVVDSDESKNVTNASSAPLHHTSCGPNKMTTANVMDDPVPPQSTISLTSEASSQLGDDQQQRLRQQQEDHNFHMHIAEEEDIHPSGNCCAGEEERRPPSIGQYFQQMEEVPRIYIERLYENTVDGPCQTVSLCELNHMDLFIVSCSAVAVHLEVAIQHCLLLYLTTLSQYL